MRALQTPPLQPSAGSFWITEDVETLRALMATSVAQILRPVGQFTTTAHKPRQIRAVTAAAPLKPCFGNVKTFSSGTIKSFRRQIDTRCRAAAPLVGNEAPDFTAEAVFDQEFQTITLSQYKGKYVVLFFYPLDFTFVCPTEITAFSDRFDEFKKINAEVLGVSVDSPFSHLAWCQTDRKEGGVGDLAYPLVSDLKREISTKYNVLADEGVALRGLFIIDKEGVIQHATINNLAFGRSVDETLRVLQAIQYVQENPDEVCPAGWKPGEATMKPTPKDSKEYFAAL